MSLQTCNSGRIIHLMDAFNGRASVNLQAHSVHAARTPCHSSAVFPGISEDGRDDPPSLQLIRALSPMVKKIGLRIMLECNNIPYFVLQPQP